MFQINLKEECEADPLVVLVLHHLLLVDDWPHSRVRNLTPNLCIDQLGEGEGGVDPAVGVHHILGNVRVNDAVDMVA